MDLLNIDLSSDRVFLREMNEEDWVDVHRYASQERVSLFQPWGPNSEEDTKAFVQQVLEDSSQENRTRYVFAIVNKEDNKMIGAGELNIRDRDNKAGEISYIVNPDFWGNGIATDVANLLITLGFKEFKLHRIFATCDPRNIGSFRVMEKVGMIREGIIRDALKLKDGWRDSLLFSVLEYEWQK
ncbi:GNAT family N-acetyltransferase [Metabacillus sp. JX24]|uniref:GNAT family N-acetyltransferase n=1 Tax=Metabacillus sp. JX24 TaxID=3240759 RepID=UPI00350F3123